MELVLETCETPGNSWIPVLRMDGQPVQAPIPVTKPHAKRVDDEYERAGTATIFMFTEPLPS